MSENNGTPQIEKGVPIPTSKPHDAHWAFLGDMEVGDSVFLSYDFLSADRSSMWKAYARTERRWPERKFTSRKQADGRRVWRIA